MTPLKPNDAITAAFNLLPVKMAGKEARIMLLAIQLQEDPQQLRRQMGDGPARGLWQFEKAGVRGVLGHPTTGATAAKLCNTQQVVPATNVVIEWLPDDDVLAAGFARLLLWTDPAKLPAIGEVRQAFDLYLRTWRPGAYTRGTDAKKMALYTKFQLNYAKAMDLVTG